ncbi:DUF3575 domain-containing protein [Treponema sp. TIM-1]|uniref:DUF3575 domain-containing protein n=1 Tax=Treponema sp. TIM-1 TaxID=2898417 RepID=UPI003980D4F0
MKKILFTITILLIIQNSIFCQNSRDRKITIQINPILLYADLVSLIPLPEYNDSNTFLFSLEGQYKLTEMFNISLEASFKRLSFRNPEGMEFQMTFKPGFIIRPFETGLKGFYIGLYSNVGWLNVTVTDDRYIDRFFVEIGSGIVVGYKWIFNHGFTLQLGGGIGKTFSIPEKYASNDSYMNSDGRMTVFKGTFDLIAFDIKIGYSF